MWFFVPVAGELVAGNGPWPVARGAAERIPVASRGVWSRNTRKVKWKDRGMISKKLYNSYYLCLGLVMEPREPRCSSNIFGPEPRRCGSNRSFHKQDKPKNSVICIFCADFDCILEYFAYGIVHNGQTKS